MALAHEQLPTRRASGSKPFTGPCWPPASKESVTFATDYWTTRPLSNASESVRSVYRRLVTLSSQPLALHLAHGLVQLLRRAPTSITLAGAIAMARLALCGASGCEYLPRRRVPVTIAFVKRLCMGPHIDRCSVVNRFVAKIMRICGHRPLVSAAICPFLSLT